MVYLNEENLGKNQKTKKTPTTCKFWQSRYKNIVRRTGEELIVKESKLVLNPSSNLAG